MESLDLNSFSEIRLPKFFKIRQKFKKDKIENISYKIRGRIKPYIINLRNKRIAVGVGSRGIANINIITRTVVDSLKEEGAVPFIVPAMGSHGGSTESGQKEILASYGITEKSMGVSINASMDVQVIGEYEPGLPVYISKSAISADGIVIIPRIKPHTGFRGKVESGICKMLSIGLGKQMGADSIHSKGFGRFSELIPGIGCMVAEKTNLLFALALVENAYDETCKIEFVTKDEIINLKKEEMLLEESRRLMGRILIPKFDVLVISEIGKNISGNGQDPNVTGLYFTKYANGGPKFKKCVILDLTEESHGNANGVGVSDVITRKLFDKIDFKTMYTNCFTSTYVEPAKVPMVASNSEDAIKMAVKICNGIKNEDTKIVWIKNTMKLENILVSEPLLKEVQLNSSLDILTEPRDLKFYKGEPEFL
ncbi:lactate racemase domain-containing protein [Clostridium sp. MT-14]|uniref:Nickel-dependent lactate racemase n=1 Tax=Clostridium aromativorans TaxID=2836848 RepID=A0ABS8N3D2_9CLOT|nr:lactate racemase domain-containing protein [Clostridium aromativorans]MCC9294181.1 nickel-dependent lactate racemase [Clostridium aromativorans]CAB1240264.1 Iron-sulfur cluster binding protein [Clostridiaceae bacterium BL-3]